MIRAVLMLLVATALSAQVPGEVRGRIRDATTQAAIPRARVELVGRSEVAYSSTDGSFVLRGIEPRAYTLRVRAIGYASREFDVTIENGRSSQRDVDLLSALTLSTVDVTAARAPAAAMTYDRAAIETSRRRDLGELLDATPGVVITRNGGPGAASKASIRGSGANQVLVLVDGVVLNSDITGEADLSRISLESVERVTVHPGAQSARFGPRALAGVIEVQTRRAHRERMTLLRAGAFGEQQASVALADSLGVALSLTADYRTVDGAFTYNVPAVRGGGRAERFNVDATSREIGLRTSVGRETGGATVRGSWNSVDRGTAGSVVQPSRTGRQHGERWSGGVDGWLARSSLVLNGSLDFTSDASEARDPNPPFGNPFSDSLRVSGATFTSSATIQRRTFSVSTGIDARALRASASYLEKTGRQDLQSVWAGAKRNASIALADVTAEVMIRADHSSLGDNTTVSPRAALTAMRGHVSTALSLASGYSPPTLADQFFREGVRVRANPGLRAERVRNDAEARISLREMRLAGIGASFDVAVFRADIDGMILWQPNFQYIWSPSNFDVRRSGFEIASRVRVTRIDVAGTFNRSNVEYAGPVLSGQVAYRPRSTANLSVGAPVSRFRIESATRYVGDRRTVNGSGLNSLEPYWVSDLRVSSTFAAGAWSFDTTVGIENLFDRDAAMLVDYPFPGRAWAIAVRTKHR